MNQIVIFGVALLIAYSAGVPVNEQPTETQIINELQTMSPNSTVSTMKLNLCFIHEAIFIGKDVCEFSCGNGCKFPFCGGYSECKIRGPHTHQCFCRLGKTLSNDESKVVLSNNEDVKNSFLSVLAQNEPNGEVAANH